jgi:hypothetical protein
MIYPRIHLNGTGGETLLNEYGDAIEQLTDALYALQQVTVHGRDYYVQATATGPDPSSVAMDEHRARIKSLQGVLAELTAIYSNLGEQLCERNRP